MNFSEKWGKDIETATELALKELKTSIEEVKVTVLEEPSKGFLGIGSKLALVRVEKIEKYEDLSQKVDLVEEVGKNIDDVIEEKIEEAEIFSKTPLDDNSIEYDGKILNKLDSSIAVDFLKNTTEKMGISLDFDAFGNSEYLYIKISGKDSGTIIGKRGQTLDAIQYLTGLVVNKNEKDYIRVILDAENYREKREQTLIRLANRLADKVVRTKRSVKLEPMNPYERMVIHSTLQSNEKIITRSEGEEPYRRIVIELK